MFDAVYRNTQFLLLQDTAMGFGLSLITPFIIYLIPGYSLYYFYKNKCSIHEISYISKFSLIFINEVYAYTLFLIIFYLSYLFKRQIFDYLILIINFVIYVANFWLIEFKESENENGNV